MKNKNFFLIFITVLIVVIAVIVNMNIATNFCSISEITLSNIDALANDENGESGWTKEEKDTTHYTNGQPAWQKIEIDCIKGGPNSSCEKSCTQRLYYNGAWHDWTNC